MSELNACILDYQSLGPDDLDLSKLWQQKVGAETVKWSVFNNTPVHLTRERIQFQDIILTNKVEITRAILEAHPGIRCIIILATGTNNVDLLAATELNIPVCNIQAYSTESVVQQTFAMMLALKTQLRPYCQAVEQGAWCESTFFGLLNYPISQVSGSTLGIIGYGAIGQRVKVVAEAFGMEVIIGQSLSGEIKVDRVEIDTLLCSADVVSIHSPLTAESHNLIDRDAFQAMKNTAILLNLGRGGIVNEKALAEALKSGDISGAAMDVISQEPPPVDHVLMDHTIPNLLITPHIGWASQQARQQLLDQTVDILQSLTHDTIKNCVNLINP